MVRWHARVRRRPRGERRDLQPAWLHPAGGRVWLGQGLSPGHRRSAHPSSFGHDRRALRSAWAGVRRQLRADQSQHRARARARGRTPADARVTGAELAAAVRAELEPRRQEMIDLLGRLVAIESPSDDRAGLDRFADELEALFGAFGPIERLDPGDPQRGRHLRLTVDRAAAPDGQPRAVALCHYDTVWATGPPQRIPFSVDADGVARGPGCFDMKGGMVVLYYALQALRARGLAPARPLHVLFTSDEEIGSPTSRAVIEQTARGAAGAYALESPLPGGPPKAAPK